MKLRIRSDDASTQQGNDWHQMNYWLAELRDDDGGTEPPGAEPAEPTFSFFEPTVGRAEPTAGPAEPGAGPAEPTVGRAEPGAGRADPTVGRAEPGAGRAEPGAGRAEPGASPVGPATASAGCVRPEAKAEPVAPVSAAALPERAVIGDQLRMPIMWCEMGSCISWHADRSALGEADARTRAIGVGWRIDAFGRLACPRCQQTDPGFRATRPVVPWDRYTAMVRAARIAVRNDQSAHQQPAVAGYAC